MAPASASLALWPDRRSLIGRGAAALEVLADSARRAAAVLARAAAEAEAVAPRFAFFGKQPAAPWPGGDCLLPSLADSLAARVADPDLGAHLMARALAGRAADPFLAGSALHGLAPGSGDGFALRGGAGALAEVLVRLATGAGAEIVCGSEVAEIRPGKRGLVTVALAGGEELAARAVISTLDVKQTFLSLFVWDALPPELVRRVGGFRMAGGTARVLVALDAPPELGAAASRAVLHVAPDAQGMADAYAAWRAGTIPAEPPTCLRLVSAGDPGLAPAGKAVMTATLAGIPFRLFDGAWTHEKRDLLRARALAAAESVLPGVAARVMATEVIVPPDIEAALGATEGDLMGGEIAADQMLGARPWLGCGAPRTPVEGLYLAGASTPSGVQASLVSGVIAAHALIADLKAGRLK